MQCVLWSTYSHPDACHQPRPASYQSQKYCPQQAQPQTQHLTQIPLCGADRPSHGTLAVNAPDLDQLTGAPHRRRGMTRGT